MAKCFECETEATHRHHVVPRSLGGTKTVSLCDLCHPKAHGQEGPWTTSELTKQALKLKRAKSEKLGGTLPYGYKLVGKNKLAIDPKEFKIVLLMHSLKNRGWTTYAIANFLNEQNIPTKTRKNPWERKSIMQVLQRTKDAINEADL